MALRIGRSLLRYRIKKAKLTQRETAKRLGVPESFISMVIKGERPLSLQRAVNLARILDCRVEDLNEWHEVSLSELRGEE